jgi:hypothetical protein
MEGSVYYSGNRGDDWIQLGDALSAENRVLRIAIDPQEPRNVYAAVGWSDGFRLLGWDPASVEMGGSASED